MAAPCLQGRDFPMMRAFLPDIRRGNWTPPDRFPEKDLWIADHRPFTFVKHPLVSAAMVVETFMEAPGSCIPPARARSSQVRLMDMIQCPPAAPAAFYDLPAAEPAMVFGVIVKSSLCQHRTSLPQED